MQQIIITEHYDPSVLDDPVLKIPRKSGIKMHARMNAWIKVGGELQLKTIEIRSTPYEVEHTTTKGKKKLNAVVDAYCYETGTIRVPVDELRVLADNVRVFGARDEKCL